MNEGRLADLRRRIDNLLRVGTVAAVDLARARVQVHYGVGTPEDAALEARTEWIPWLTTRAGADRAWWAPSVGEQVVILAPSGDLVGAAALPAIFSVQAPPPGDVATRHVVAYADGAVISYDAETHVLQANLPGGGLLHVVGDVADKASTMQEMRDVYNAHTHPVPGGGNTGLPSSRM